MKKKILLICTGGTIASRKTQDGLAPQISAEDILSYVPGARNYADIDAVQVCNIDSTNMTPAHWQLLVETVEKNYEAYDGFVICHGTDTMAYTSAALSYMIQNSEKPIVITGAQKPIDMDITDARNNLLDSIIYAADDASRDVVILESLDTSNTYAIYNTNAVFVFLFQVKTRILYTLNGGNHGQLGIAIKLASFLAINVSIEIKAFYLASELCLEFGAIEQSNRSSATLTSHEVVPGFLWSIAHGGNGT